MLHLIAYDIGHPRRLRRVAKICTNYGVRMEKSVFECDLTDEQMAQFWQQLERVVDVEEDRVFDYRIGTVDRLNIRRMGHAPETPNAEEMVVL